MNALQVEGVDALDGFVGGFASHPAEGFAGPTVGEDDVVVFSGNSGDQCDRSREIFDFSRNGKSRVDHDRHRKFVPVAVIDNAALGRKWDRALLLVSGLLDEFSVAEDLQIHKPAADGDAPEEHDRAEKVEAGVLGDARVSSGHGNLSS